MTQFFVSLMGKKNRTDYTFGYRVEVKSKDWNMAADAAYDMATAAGYDNIRVMSIKLK